MAYGMRISPPTAAGLLLVLVAAVSSSVSGEEVQALVDAMVQEAARSLASELSDRAKSTADEPPTFVEKWKAGSDYLDAQLGMPPTYEALEGLRGIAQTIPDPVTDAILDQKMADLAKAKATFEGVHERQRQFDAAAAAAKTEAAVARVDGILSSTFVGSILNRDAAHHRGAGVSDEMRQRLTGGAVGRMGSGLGSANNDHTKDVPSVAELVMRNAGFRNFGAERHNALDNLIGQNMGFGGRMP